MNWKNEYYQEKVDLLGEVRGYMACNPSIFDLILDVEIQHYIDLACAFRDSYKKEKAKEDGRRSESVRVGAVRARLHLPQRDFVKFYPTRECDYLTPERVFLLACVAVTGSRDGAATLSAIALPRRNLKGLREHINTYLKESDVPYQD